MANKTSETELRLLRRAEHDAWRKLCFELRSRGVVTQLDLESEEGEVHSSGCRLLNSIREWCELRVKLEKAETP
jgi:hypothetical protein